MRIYRKGRQGIGWDRKKPIRKGREKKVQQSMESNGRGQKGTRWDGMEQKIMSRDRNKREG